VIAKEGDTLPDGTTVDEIEVNGGVAINVFGEVAFHGRTGGVQAVFISDGQTIQVVAKVGDNVNDGTTLSEINDTAGVTIKPYGFEVAFHGRIGTTDAVFVGLASPPTPNIPPEADFSFTTDDLTANFEDLSTDSDGDVVAWSWDFGDGSTSTEQNPSHTYDTEGTYDVSLTVTDDDGAESEPTTASVEVTAPPSGDVVQVFVTNATYLGDLGGLAGGDAKCQELAEDVGLAGTWTAWLSTSGSGSDVDAPDRIPDGRYELLDETVIADDKADLTDGELNAPINLDQFGNPISDGFAWTGTSLLGRSTGTNCSNWTNQTQGRCTEGAPGCGDIGDITDKLLWTSGFPTACDNALHLYCFSSSE
jgi:PKD repeat protein